MATMQGKVRAVELCFPEIGDKVIVPDTMEIGTIRDYKPGHRMCPVVVHRNGERGEIMVVVSKLRTLIVAYKTGRMLESLPPIEETGAAPLKWSQWQAAIDNKEVDSDKTVNFELIVHNRPQVSGYHIAKIIPEKKNTEADETYQACMWWFSLPVTTHPVILDRAGMRETTIDMCKHPSREQVVALWKKRSNQSS